MTRRRSPSRARRGRAVTVALDALLAVDEQLRGHHERCTALGMALGQPRVWRRRDGGFTARFVWSRHDGANTTSMVYSCSYVPEAGAS